MKLLCCALTFALATSASAQPPVCTRCTLSLSTSVILDDAAGGLRGAPTLVSATRAGQFIVTEDANTPPAVFGSDGRFIGRLGREGRGPGELTFAGWVDSELDDSIRVIDVDRVVVFNKELRPIRTVVGKASLFVWTAAFLRRGVYVSQSRMQDSRDLTRTVPLVVRSDSGRELARIEVPKLNGQKTFVKLARKLDDSRAFWMTESVVKELSGYRVVAMSEAGIRQRSFLQPRSWWVSADFDRNEVAALSRVMFIRQMDTHHLAVLIAQPIKDWRSVVVSPTNMLNDRDRYQTVIELLDARTGALIGAATTSGFPISLLPDRRAAVYREAADGTPRIEILQFARDSSAK